MIYTESFPIQFSGAASEDAVVIVPGARFTVLTPRLLRLEYDPQNHFEDRPSKTFWYRRQPVPPFEVRQEGDRLEIETAYLLLRYQISEAGFTGGTLSITLKESGVAWQYGQEDPLNLLGTERTLDNVDGALVLEEGLLSRQGWAVYDDSQSLVFDDRGWVEPRSSMNVDQQTATNTYDLYFFGYGQDYEGCLRDFTAVAGVTPMVPRWILGNWWSRYWAYSDQELLDLMDEFREHDVPLAVCIVDMDWHITDTGNASSGWTGYTWNRELFPDPPGFIKELHHRGLRTALNLHPADGVYPHEEQYPAMAERLGVDPASGERIPFDIAKPDFARAYFELLHHPYEADGVDFWWLDWQQGTVSGMAGLDPLWWLNHLHFYDLGRDGQKQPFVFSRWGGLGNHRYPIGFSGDAVVTWDSLAFQPYFTATAANVNYGWWSHDIGGHMGGVEEPELFARWVQFGVFSPIFRLHCTNNPFHERRPWAYDAETEAVTAAAMRLRHALIPYLYTMAWRNHTEHVPLVRPMYQAYPLQEPAYHCPDQYLFGSELIVAPFITPAAEDTRLSRQVIWLPDGDWFNFFDGQRYEGSGWHTVYGSLKDIPAFAKTGAIVPLAGRSSWSDTGNPQALGVHLFPGADNEFVLYEDDPLPGGGSCETRIRAHWSLSAWQIAVEPAEGEIGFLPATRTFELYLRGITEDVLIEAAIDGEPVEAPVSFDEETSTLRVSTPAKAAAQRLEVTVTTAGGPLQKTGDSRLAICRRLVYAFKMESWTKSRLSSDLPAIVDNPHLLAGYELSLTTSQIQALVEVITGSGAHRSSVRRAAEEAIILWNNQESDAVTYRLVATDLNRSPQRSAGPLPRFAVLHVGENILRWQSGEATSGLITIDDWFDTLAERVEAALPGGAEAIVQLDLSGPGGRSAYIILRENKKPQLSPGRHALPDVTIAAGVADWLGLINGFTVPEEAFLAGRLSLVGDFLLARRLVAAIGLVPQNSYLADRWRLDLNYLDMATVSFGR